MYIYIYIYRERERERCIHMPTHIRQGDPAERTTVEQHLSTPCFLQN